jgi:hypothetical protein
MKTLLIGGFSSLLYPRIQAFDLIGRSDFDLRLSFVKLDCAGDTDDFPLESGDSLIGLHF